MNIKCVDVKQKPGDISKKEIYEIDEIDEIDEESPYSDIRDGGALNQKSKRPGGLERLVWFTFLGLFAYLYLMRNR